MAVDPAVLAGLAALLGGGIAAAVSKLFDKKKDDATVSKTIGDTYSRLVQDLNAQLVAHDAKTERLLEEERKRCDERMAAIEAHLNRKLATLQAELDKFISPTTNKDAST